MSNAITTPVARLSDEELVSRCREGDQAAWEELVDRYASLVYAVARRAFGFRMHDAEEVFQETFTRIWEHLDELEESRAIAGWIRQIARRLCIDRLRAHSCVELPEDETELPPELDEALEQLDVAVSVQQAMAKVARPAREVLERFFLRDESYQRISDALGIPHGTIASRIARGLQTMRGQLDH